MDLGAPGALPGPPAPPSRDYFTADLHLGHRSVMKHSHRTEFMTATDREEFESIRDSGDAEALSRWKPTLDSVHAMDEALLANLNEVVPVDATLWILGDFAMTGSKVMAKKYRDAIRCRDVRMIWGNNDRRHRMKPLFDHCYDAIMIHVAPLRTYTEDEIHFDKELRHAAKTDEWKASVPRAYLSHYAHCVWHRSSKGAYHLYGHSHGNFDSWRDQHMPNALMLDVGVDANDYAPLPWPAIHNRLYEKFVTHPAHVVDHHDGV
ncbi:MAG: hypothetical protein AAGI17_09830 [Planctomycetota bacterium]